MPIVNKFPIGGEKIIDGTNIFGVQLDDPSSLQWTRTDLSAQFPEPVPALSGGSGSSKFDKYLPWRGMVKEDVTGAGTCVKIPKFWYKLTQNGDGVKIQIADYAASGFSVSPAHMNRGDGKGERNYVYVGRFHCASDYTSKSGVNPIESIAMATARTNIHNLGSTIWQIDFTMVFTIWLLYLVEIANSSSQNAIGKGITLADNNQTTHYTSGRTNNMAYHTGTLAASRSSYGVCQYRYIEDMWGNIADYLDGCYRTSTWNWNITLNPANFANSANGIVAGVFDGSSIYNPSIFTVYNPSNLYPIFLPTKNNATSPHDNWAASVSHSILWGASGNDRKYNRGLFRIDSKTHTTTNNVSGCRLMVLP